TATGTATAAAAVDDAVAAGDGAVAQIGDAGAAQHAEGRERRAVGRPAQRALDEVAGALERRAEVRRAPEDEGREAAQPRVARGRGGVAGGAGDQAAHAVADDDDFRGGDGPIAHQRLERRREVAAIRGNGTAAVVANVDRR